MLPYPPHHPHAHNPLLAIVTVLPRCLHACRYEVELQNRGKIDVHYQLIPPSSAFGSKFAFEPDQGHLTGGQIQVIKVKLLSDLLGTFDEVRGARMRV